MDILAWKSKFVKHIHIKENPLKERDKYYDFNYLQKLLKLE